MKRCHDLTTWIEFWPSHIYRYWWFWLSCTPAVSPPLCPNDEIQRYVGLSVQHLATKHNLIARAGIQYHSWSSILVHVITHIHSNSHSWSWLIVWRVPAIKVTGPQVPIWPCTQRHPVASLRHSLGGSPWSTRGGFLMASVRALLCLGLEAKGRWADPTMVGPSKNANQIF